MAKLIAFAGTGATGKTSVVNKCLELAPGLFTSWPSIVREFYALNGYKNELEFRQIADGKARIDFQRRLFQFYMERLRQALNECKTPFLIADRSAIDHAGYTIYGAGNDLTKELYNEVVQQWLPPFVDLDPYVFMMPFPVHWDEASSNDGFRDRTFQKDLCVDAYINKIANSLPKNRFKLFRMTAGTSIGVRADEVIWNARYGTLSVSASTTAWPGNQ